MSTRRPSQSAPPTCSAALSSHPIAAAAAGEVIGHALERVGVRPDLAVCFLSGAHSEFVHEIVSTIRRTLNPGALIGATAFGVLGGQRTVEALPALSLWTANVGEVCVVSAGRGDEEGGVTHPFGLTPPSIENAHAAIVLSDASSVPSDDALASLACCAPDLRIAGGVASGGLRGNATALICNDTILRQGSVGVILPPDCAVDVIVSQGYRSVGPPMVVTGCDGPTVTELAGAPAFESFQEILRNISPDDRELLRAGTHVGIFANENRSPVHEGAILVRPVLGIDRMRRALIFSHVVATGTIIQFQVRDASSAHDDLTKSLAEAVQQEVASSLIFASSIRNRMVFDSLHHDARVVGEWTDAPHAGMISEREIGPIGSATYLHRGSVAALLFH